MGGDVLPPRVLFRTMPDFSKLARTPLRRTPIVQATVGPDGLVREVHVVRPSRQDVDEAMVAAVRQWRFAPATRGGRPVAVHYTVTANIDYQ